MEVVSLATSTIYLHLSSTQLCYNNKKIHEEFIKEGKECVSIIRCHFPKAESAALGL